MKRIRILTILVFLFSGTLTAKKNDVIVTISGHKISKAEFERIYLKNNQALADDADIKSPRDYVDMYIDFKLKVLEAMELGMDTAKSFINELAGFRSDLAAPYLTDMKYDEHMVEELYQRMQKEISASHILFRVNNDAEKEQEEAVLNKALKVKQEILDGRDFNDAAYEYSDDPSAKTNKGNLGYFTAFQMVTPFENQAYNTPAGKISEPFRTSFGYHLIKVHDVRDNQGEIKVAHIMKMFPRNEQYDKDALKKELDSVYQQLIQGADFEDLVIKHSDDKRSVAEKGEIPWFPAGQMIPEFAGPAFNLKNKGDFTPPVETPFGFHIIKKIGHRPVPPFEEVRASIEQRIKKDPLRSSSTRKAFTDKLKEEYGFRESPENIKMLSNIAVQNEIKENPLLFTFGSDNFFLNDFIQYLSDERIKDGMLAEHLEDWIEHEIIKTEDSRLEEKYPEFGYLMQEYHDGLLFFNIMEEKIWNFAGEDSTGLENFYASNKGMFLWEERFKGLIITCKDAYVRGEAEKYFDAGLSTVEVEDLLNSEEKLIETKAGEWEQGSNPVVDYYIWNGPLKAGFNPDLTFLKGNIAASEPKTLNEAKGLYISAYQDYLERNWIKSLRKKHKIKIRKKLLKSIPHA